MDGSVLCICLYGDSIMNDFLICKDDRVPQTSIRCGAYYYYYYCFHVDLSSWSEWYATPKYPCILDQDWFYFTQPPTMQGAFVSLHEARVYSAHRPNEKKKKGFGYSIT